MDANFLEGEISKGQTALTLRGHFPSFRKAVEFYAATRTAQFTGSLVGKPCSACQCDSARQCIEFRWVAYFTRISDNPWSILHVLLGHIWSAVKTEAVTFSTFHRFCVPCWQRTVRTRRVRIVLQCVFLALVLSGISAMLVCAFEFLLSARFESAPPAGGNHTDQAVLSGVAGCLAALLGIFIRLQTRLMGVPNAIRAVAPRPFLLRATVPLRAVTINDGTRIRDLQLPAYRPVTLSWQQAAIIVLIVFVGIPAFILCVGAGIQPNARQMGWWLLGIFFASVTVLWLSHLRRRSRNREAYYAKLTALLIAKRC